MELEKQLNSLKNEFKSVKKQLRNYYWVSDYRYYVKVTRDRIKVIEKLIDNNEGEKWLSWVDKEIIKKSNKPFKSGKQVGMVSEITINPYSEKLGFKMDDGSIVDCYQCNLK